MKFDVYMTLQGPGGVAEVPAIGNPREAEDIECLLRELTSSIHVYSKFGALVVGVRVQLYSKGNHSYDGCNIASGDR